MSTMMLLGIADVTLLVSLILLVVTIYLIYISLSRRQSRYEASTNEACKYLLERCDLNRNRIKEMTEHLLSIDLQLSYIYGEIKPLEHNGGIKCPLCRGGLMRMPAQNIFKCYSRNGCGYRISRKKIEDHFGINYRPMTG